MKNIALYGGSFIVSGLHHRKVAETIAKSSLFDKVIVYPCAARNDRTDINHVNPIHRAAMADLNFKGLRKVEVILDDLEKDEFTPNVELEKRFGKNCNLWHAVGSEWIRGGRSGSSKIQQVWTEGAWNRLRFLVIERPGYPANPEDMPPNCLVIHADIQGSGDAIRERLFKGMPIDGLVTDSVRDYIERHGILRSNLMKKMAEYPLPDPRFLLRFDKENPKAALIADRIKPQAPAKNHNFEVVIGGDGTVLKFARQDWRRRIPIFGLNAGRVGYLSNGLDETFSLGFPPKMLCTWLLPMLFYEMEGVNGKTQTGIAFNEVMCRNKTSYRRRNLQGLWLETSIEGPDEYHFPAIGTDGMIISTPQGSSGYGVGAGATPLRIDDSSSLLLAGYMPFSERWRWAPISIHSTVRIVNNDPRKRPMNGFADCNLIGEIRKMTVRVSRIAAVELAFLPGHDLARKHTENYFR